MSAAFHSLPSVLAKLEAERPFGNERERAIALHDFVRDHIRFGFTAGFERVTPEQTLAARRGHCNAQADLFRALLALAGLAARLRFTLLDKRILRHAVPLPIYLCLPNRLFHAVTQVRVDGRWVNTDSYLFDLPTFWRQHGRLAKSGKTMGFGLSLGASCLWNGREDAFCQARSALLHPDSPVYPSLAAAVATRTGHNMVLGRHINDWLTLIPRALHGPYESYVNRLIEEA